MTQQSRKPMTFNLVDAPATDPVPTPKAAGKTYGDRQQLGARVSKDLYRRFRVHAVQTGAKMEALIEEAMEAYLASRLAK